MGSSYHSPSAQQKARNTASAKGQTAFSYTQQANSGSAATRNVYKIMDGGC